MVKEEDLLTSLKQLEGSLDSTNELLLLVNEIAGEKEANMASFRLAQRKAMLDSLNVKRTHKQYKVWENEKRDNFIASEIKAYNKKYAQMSRLHTDLSELEEKLNDTRKQVYLPNFRFSIQTLQNYDNGSLLKYVKKDEAGTYPLLVRLGELFSLEPNSTQLAPDFQTFNKLVNLEFHLRTLCQIKYEVLLRIKAHLDNKNSQWAKRDNSLNAFITRDLRETIDLVKKIRASETQDLRDIDVDSEFDYDGERDEERDDEDEEKDPEENGEEQNEDQGENQNEERSHEGKDHEENYNGEDDVARSGDDEEIREVEESQADGDAQDKMNVDQEEGVLEKQVEDDENEEEGLQQTEIGAQADEANDAMDAVGDQESTEMLID